MSLDDLWKTIQIGARRKEEKEITREERKEEKENRKKGNERNFCMTLVKNLSIINEKKGGRFFNMGAKKLKELGERVEEGAKIEKKKRE